MCVLGVCTSTSFTSLIPHCSVLDGYILQDYSTSKSIIQNQLQVVSNVNPKLGYIQIASCPQLTLISFNFLTFISGGFYILMNNMLTYISLPSLTYIGGKSDVIAIEIYNNARLSSIYMPLIQFMGYQVTFLICANGLNFTIPPAFPSLWQGSSCQVIPGSTSCSMVNTQIDLQLCPTIDGWFAVLSSIYFTKQ